MAASRTTKRTVMIQAFERAGIKPWHRYIEYLLKAKQYSGATDLDRYLDAYQATCDPNHNPGVDRRWKTPEELCEMSATSPGVIMGHIARQLWDLATPDGNMLQAISHVDIIKTWIREAKKPTGVRDRESFLKANGAIPIPSKSAMSCWRSAIHCGREDAGHIAKLRGRSGRRRSADVAGG